MRMKTRAVAGSVYPRLSSTRQCLTHAVDEETARVFCTRVKYVHLLDDDYATDPTAPPTCPTCRKAWDRLHM